MYNRCYSYSKNSIFINIRFYLKLRADFNTPLKGERKETKNIRITMKSTKIFVKKRGHV